MRKNWVVVYDDQSFVWFNSFHTFRWMARVFLFLTRRRHAATMLAKDFYIGTVGKGADGGVVVRVQVRENRK